MKTIVIGFTGKIGTGKTTAARYLVDKFGFIALSFGSALKTMALRSGLVDVADIYSTPKTDWGRKFLQQLATDVIRDQVDAGFWVRKVRAVALHILAQNYSWGVVVEDIRFPNELEMVQHMGGSIIRMERPAPETNFSKHSSETLQDEFPADLTILNNGSLEELYNHLDRYMAFLLTITNRGL